MNVGFIAGQKNVCMFAETSCELEVLDLQRDRKRTKAVVIVKILTKTRLHNMKTL